MAGVVLTQEGQGPGQQYARFIYDVFGSDMVFWNAGYLRRWALFEKRYVDHPIIFCYQPNPEELWMAFKVFGSEPLVIEPA